jgi:hypothetical protein
LYQEFGGVSRGKFQVEKSGVCGIIQEDEAVSPYVPSPSIETLDSESALMEY